MRIVSADITGSLILNGVDVTDSFVSSSVDSGSFTQKIDSLQSSTSSLNSFTSSINNTIKNKLDSETVISGSIQVNITGTTGYSTFSSSVATTTVGTKNRVDSIEAKTGSYATTGSNTFIGTENITGNLTVTGSVIISSGSAVYNSSLNLTDTSSLTLNSGSNLYVYDSGIISGTFKGSVTGSLGINGNVSITGSIVASGTSLVSGSSQIDITSTTNYTTFSSSVSSSIGNLSSSVATNTSGLSGRITTIEGNYATTGSNVFVGSQVITGSLYITTDLIVQGSSSLQNITASAVSIGTNTVILNTDTPAVRFAGISVQDSGSNVGVTGSIFWDGLCNRWVYSNPSGVGYTGGLLISGPRNVGTLGDEVGTTSCALMIGQGGDHITSSAIFHYGNATCFYGTSFISGSGQICAPSFVGGSSTGTCAIFNTLTAGNSGGASVNISTNGNNGTSEAPLQTNLNFRGLNNNLNGQIRVDDISGTAQVGSMRFYTWNSAQVLSLRLDHTGVACFASTVCTPRLQVFNTSSVVVIEGTATNGEGSLTVAGKNSSGTSRSAVFKYDNADVIRISTADAIPMRFETSDVARMSISSTGISCFSCQICAPVAIFSGCVGINETSPSSMLHFSKQTTWGTSNNRVININNTGTGGDINTAHNMGSITWYSGNDTPTAEIAAYRNTPASGNNIELRFYTATGGTPLERMRITSTGLVGLNTTNFGERLNIGCGGAIAWQNTCNCQKWHIQYNSADGLNFVESAVADFRLFLRAGGNVGIGTSTPSDKLQVLGSLRWGGSTNNVVSSNDASGVYLEINGTSTATRRLRIQGINDAGNKYSQFFINAGAGEMCFVTEDIQRLLIGSNGIANFSNTVCAANFSSPGFLRVHNTMKTFAISKNFGERETDANYFRISSSVGNGYQVMVYSVAQNPAVGWVQSQLFQAATAPYWGGWVGTSGAITTTGSGAGFISSVVNGNDGTITFRVTTGSNGTVTTGTIVSYIQVTAFNIDNISLTAL